MKKTLKCTVLFLERVKRRPAPRGRDGCPTQNPRLPRDHEDVQHPLRRLRQRRSSFDRQ